MSPGGWLTSCWDDMIISGTVEASIARVADVQDEGHVRAAGRERSVRRNPARSFRLLVFDQTSGEFCHVESEFPADLTRRLLVAGGTAAMATAATPTLAQSSSATTPATCPESR